MWSTSKHWPPQHLVEPKVGWAPQPGWTMWWRQKYLPFQKSTLNSVVIQPTPKHNAESINYNCLKSKCLGKRRDLRRMKLSRGSSFRIVTILQTGRLRRVRQAQETRPALGPPKNTYSSGYRELSPQRWRGPILKLTTRLYLLPRLRMKEAIPQLSHISSSHSWGRLVTRRKQSLEDAA